MSNYGRNPRVIQMRAEFESCPGCFRSRDQIYAQRPNPAMSMNQCLTVEHVHARYHGGSNHHGNLIIICHRCNFHRGSQSPWDWFGAQNGEFAQGWPCPPIFFGRNGRARQSRNLWMDRSAAFAALLGHGPQERLIGREHDFDPVPSES